MVSCLSSCPWEAEELSKVQLQQTKLLQVWNHLFWKLLSLGNKNICTRQPPLHVLLRKKICQGHQSSLLSKTQKGWITCKRVFFGDCFKNIYICMYSYVFVFMWKKKCTAQEWWVKFHLGQNEDYSPGDSFSDNCEELLWRGGGRSLYVISMKRMLALKHTFWQTVTASHKEQISPLTILVLF